MTYQLYSTGQLVEGVDERQALPALQRIMQLPEEQIRKHLLNGERRKLASNEERNKLERLHDLLTKAGLAVELISESPPPPSSPPTYHDTAQTTGSGQGIRPKRRRFGWLRRFAIALLLLLSGIAAYGWYWLHQPLSNAGEAIEEALADGTLVAIGHADIARITFVKQRWFGAADPAALPLAGEQQALVERLFTGDANFRDNLHHAFLGIHTQQDQTVVVSWVLAGRFEETAIISALDSNYRMEALGNGRWSALKNPEQPAAFSCPEPQEAAQRSGPTTYYLQITPQWLLLSSSTAQLDHLSQRLASASTAATQDLTPWRSYRSGQLASMMVFLPAEAGKAVEGLPGMFVRKAAKDTPQLSAVAARVGIAPLSGGLHADVRLTSHDPQWNDEKGAALRHGLHEWSQGSQSISDSLTKLLSRISVESAADSLQVNLELDGEVLGEFSQSAQEAMSRLFTPQIGTNTAKGDGPVADKLLTSPTDYAANLALAQLPPYAADSHSTPPLYIDGSFAVTPETITQNNEGMFEIRVQGEVALPKAEDFNSRRSGRLTLSIDAIDDANGSSLLRDERCIKSRGWAKGNHEAEVSEFLFGNKASVTKVVRLQEGARPEEVASIKGRIDFAAPVQVRRFPLPLQAGSKIEHMGVRLYLNQVDKDGNVSFQLSGDTARFLELRALNKDDKPLASDWSMGNSESGRITQHFVGTIKTLEVYVAERFSEQRSTFVLRELFAAAPATTPSRDMHAPAPAALPPREWERYTALDLKKLHADPKDAQWHRGDQKAVPLATLVHTPVTFTLNHVASAWGNYPTADLYYPMLAGLPDTLSAISYRIDEPAGEKSGVERYVQAKYPYLLGSGELVLHHHIHGQPFARQQLTLEAGLEKNQLLQRLKGNLRFRLPLKLTSHRRALSSLWQSETIDGIEVSLKGIERRMFPGYAFEVRGDIGRLVNLYGLTATGERVAAAPVNFQDGGYWTLTLPFTAGMQEVELLVAAQQQIHDIPFELKPHYQASDN